MFAKYFIHHRVVAYVISILITLVGALAIPALPIAQYPPITPPLVEVETVYVGASAAAVEQSVATPIEQEVNGAENMIYLSSKSSSDGRYVLQCTFRLGTNIDIATVDVQNRVKKAESYLPNEVKTYGISVKKKSPDMLMCISVHSPGGEYDDVFLSNFASINLVDPIARVYGVGSTMIVGQRDYSMRTWLKPDRLARLGVTAGDVANAIREQNVQAAAGQVGQPPARAGTSFQYTVDVKGRLTEVDEFEDLVLRTNADGTPLRVRDVARVELAAKDYKSIGRLNAKPAVIIIVYQLPGANALDVAQGVRTVLDDLRPTFPSGLETEVSLDNTKYIETSIEGVVHTLVEALVLVVLVTFIFLGSFRATIVPSLAIPVSLVGTFAAFVVLGFSINTLTLFALVLAIGIVVDDAIVVVEAVEHHIAHGLDPVQASEKAMEELAGPCIAMAAVLIAVFLPVSFLGGITGQLYKQFSIAICVSVALSALVAVTLTPALSATFLKPRKEMRGPLGAFFRWFNKSFDRLTAGYVAGVRFAIKRVLISLSILAAFYVATADLFGRLPTAFVPEEDQGYFYVAMTLPDGASLERTDAILAKAEKVLLADPAVDRVITLGGLNIITGAYTSNNSTLIPVLKDWGVRNEPGLHVRDCIARCRKTFGAYPEAIIVAFTPPPIPGLGAAGGFQFELQDRGGGSIDDLARVADEFKAKAAEQPELIGLYNAFQATVPQIDLQLDRDKCKSLGVPVNAVFEGLQVFLGGLQVNDMNLFGRTYKVMVQAEPEFRMSPDNIGDIYVRGAAGGMIPLSTVVRLGDKTGTDVIQRFNLFRCAEISGAAAAGYSSGQGLDAMERVAGEVLPDGYGFAWTGTAYQEKQASGGQALVFGLAIAFVFLLLAAQYNNWAIPLGVILGLPVCVAGGLAYVFWREFANDTYVQIGIVTLIGCVAKTAILIVEFAKQKRDAGEDIDTAAVESSRLRFRPILMTCAAFTLGTVPLAVAKGAGSAARQGMGTVIIGGMIAASVISVFVVPMLFAVIERVIEKFGGGHAAARPEGAADATVDVAAPPAVVHGGGHDGGHGGGHA